LIAPGQLLLVDTPAATLLISGQNEHQECDKRPGVSALGSARGGIFRQRMNTDQEWEKWGKKDPYFAVLTGPQYRSGSLTPESKREFFQLGEDHFHGILEACLRIEPGFQPKRTLEFGCGVGRLLMPMARICQQAVGVDISDSMLKWAAIHCQEQGLRNITLLRSDDSLSLVQGKFDLIISFIVLQHIPVKRGKAIFSRLLELLEDGGIAAIDVPYARVGHSRIYDADALRPLKRALRLMLPFIFRDPEMQMNRYSMDALLTRAQRSGIKNVHIEFSARGAYLSAFLYCQKGKRPRPEDNEVNSQRSR